MPGQNQSIPPQLSEATFRVYEPFIHLAVTRWNELPGSPQDTQFLRTDMTRDGRPISPNTFSARFRDALVSLRTFKWETYINTTLLFGDMLGKYVISHDADGAVWFRGRERRGRTDGMPNAPKTGQQPTATASAGTAHILTGVWTNTPHEVIDAVCTLIHYGHLVGPVILAGEVPVDDRTRYEASYNVSLHFDSVLNQTIIQ